MTKTAIEWAEYPKATGYKVSTNGNIIGPSGKVLSPMENESGYLYVIVRRKKTFVHRMVLETFVGECPEGKETRHLDDNPKNNALHNLLWGTRIENVNDRRLHNRLPIPHKSIFTKLIPKDIPIIREMQSDGISTRKIATIFNTSHTTIQKIVRGERWKGY